MEQRHELRRARNGDRPDSFIAYCWCGKPFEAESLQDAIALCQQHVSENTADAPTTTRV